MTDFIRELLSFLWYGFASLAGICVPIKNPTEISEKRVIVLVHGWMAQDLAYYFFKRRLRQEGFEVYSVGFSFLQSAGLNIKNIKQVTKVLKTFFEKNSLTNVTLVGCSIGGLVSLLFLEDENGWQYVRKFISLSTPYHGTWLSYLALYSKAARAIRPNSLFMKEFSKRKFAHNEQMVSLYGKWDEFVLPKSSLVSKFSSMQIPEGGHAYLQTFSKITTDVISWIAKN